MRRQTPPLPKDGIYRSILWVMVVTVIGGVLIALAGDMILYDPAVNRFGAITALVGAGLYVFVRFMGAREAKRQAEEDRGAGEP